MKQLPIYKIFKLSGTAVFPFVLNYSMIISKPIKVSDELADAHAEVWNALLQIA